MRSRSVLGLVVRFQPAGRSVRLSTIDAALALVGRSDLTLRIGVRGERECGDSKDDEENQSEAAAHICNVGRARSLANHPSES